MSELLDSRQREALAALAAVALPGDGVQPSASEIDLSAAALDRALRARPDLIEGLQRILDHDGIEAEAYLHSLGNADFNLLMTVLCAAYVMDPRVQAALNYPGQQALTLDRGGFGAEELVLEMMQQPKRFRPA